MSGLSLSLGCGFNLLYDVALIQWIMLCHKNCMTTHVITLWRIHITSLTMSVSTMYVLNEIRFILKVIKIISN